MLYSRVSLLDTYLVQWQLTALSGLLSGESELGSFFHSFFLFSLSLSLSLSLALLSDLFPRIE
jgi:hypothetical protein